MRLWRLARAAFQQLDGEGARLYGGRWNSEGQAVVYLSATLSLAALEYLVHVDVADVPPDLVALEVDVPDDAGVEVIGTETLPPDWRTIPDHSACVSAANQWLASGSTLLQRVPSAIVPRECNVLLNPGHPDARRARIITAEPFAFDARLTG